MSGRGFHESRIGIPPGIGSLLLTALVLLATAGTVGNVSAQDFVVIVNKDNPMTEVSIGELSDMFLGKVTEWPNGWRLEPLDQSLESTVRLAFTKVVHKKPVGAIKRYWMNQAYSGRSAPPQVKPSDEEVVAFISANPGSIGYIQDQDTGPGVRVLSVVE